MIKWEPYRGAENKCTNSSRESLEIHKIYKSGELETAISFSIEATTNLAYFINNSTSVHNFWFLATEALKTHLAQGRHHKSTIFNEVHKKLR